MCNPLICISNRDTTKVGETTRTRDNSKTTFYCNLVYPTEPELIPTNKGNRQFNSNLLWEQKCFIFMYVY